MKDAFWELRIMYGCGVFENQTTTGLPLATLDLKQSPGWERDGVVWEDQEQFLILER